MGARSGATRSPTIPTTAVEQGRAEVRAARSQVAGPLRDRAHEGRPVAAAPQEGRRRGDGLGSGGPPASRCSARGRTTMSSTATPGRWDGADCRRARRARRDSARRGSGPSPARPTLAHQPRQGRSAGHAAIGGPITKRDIIRYYAQIAPWMTPYLAGRPVNLNRFPDGITVPRAASGTRRFPSTRPTWCAAGRIRSPTTTRLGSTSWSTARRRSCGRRTSPASRSIRGRRRRRRRRSRRTR